MSALSHRLILSSCGTSLLTNGSTDEERELLTKHTNSLTVEELGTDWEKVEERIGKVRDRLKEEKKEAVCRSSAELNGILTLLREDADLGQVFQNHHVLLCTDTWLGEETGRLVEGWLRANGQTSVEILRHRNLQTRNLDDFQHALSELVKWFERDVPAYKEQQYRIVFNLTGGFKGVQGFLQTLGNLYADETVYIFESAGALLRIPALPVRMDALESVRRHERVIRRLANNLPVAEADLTRLPGTFILRVGEQAALSPWGTVVWERSRRELYGEQVWPAPSDRVRFADTFAASVRDLSPDRLYNLNDKLEKLAVYLEGDAVRPGRSLDLKALQGNPKPPSTHEFDAWADKDARRVFCRYSGDVLVLDRLDKALH